MKLSGAEIITAVLCEMGVDTVFGYPGGNVLPLYEALSRASALRHILTASEVGAAHAADGYARASGRVGVCVATSGPGATNLVTGIATAYMDSSPIVAITGNVPVSQVGTDSFQEVDITGITQPITKHNVMVKDVRQLADALRFAFEVAMDGRRGPVLVDVPLDVQCDVCEYEPNEREATAALLVERDLSIAADMINYASNPIILAGGGTANASLELIRFAEKLGCPVAVTMMGQSNFPSSHAQFLGMAGMHGTAAAGDALAQSDLIIAVGTRFSDRVAQRSREAAQAVLHIDIDRSEINKNVLTRHFIVGDAAAVLDGLTPMVRARDTEAVLRVEPQHDAVRTMLAEVGAVSRDALIATDVGKHQVWTVASVGFGRSRTLLTSGGMGTMGFGLGAAIGGAVATGRRVLLVTGDGSFMMNQNELMTAVRERLPITVLILRNGWLDMVREQQRDMGYGYMTALDSLPDFVGLAKSYGAAAVRVDDLLEVAAAVERSHDSGTPTVIDCAVNESVSAFANPPGSVIMWSDAEIGGADDE